MPVPSYRVPVRVARGTKAALDAGLADLQEGEICYATDENALYVIEGGVLTPVVSAGGSGDLVDDTTPQLGGDLDTNSFQIISTAAGNIQIAPDTTGVLEVMGNTGNDAVIKLNCETNTHGIKLKSPPHSAAADYTLVFPNDTGSNGQALTTDGAGVMSWTTPSTVGSINDLTDVDTATTAPTTDQVLAWDGTNWVPADQTGGGGGGGDIHTSSVPISDMAGIDGFYADQAALEADGFTFASGSINADEIAILVSVPAQYLAVDYLGLGLTTLDECRVNSNGAVYFNSASFLQRSGDIVADAGANQLYVAWWSEDTETRLVGHKEVTTGGTTWLVVRADMKVPYSSSTAGFPVETWFGLDGRIRQYWGTAVDSASFTVTATSTGGAVSNGARVTTATGITGTGAYGVEYALGAPADLQFNVIGDLSDVDTTTTAPTNDQVLAWNGTHWVPADQTGGGKDRIQDMDDFELNPGASSGGELYDTKSGTQNPSNDGEWYWGYSSRGWIDFSPNDAGGNPFSEIAGTPGDGTFYLSKDGGSWEPYLLHSDGIVGRRVYLDSSYPSTEFDGVSSIRVSATDPGAIPPLPLAEGDILQWSDTDQKFKPTNDYIPLATLQAEVAASTDFTDFQSRIAAL